MDFFLSLCCNMHATSVFSLHSLSLSLTCMFRATKNFFLNASEKKSDGKNVKIHFTQIDDVMQKKREILNKKLAWNFVVVNFFKNGDFWSIFNRLIKVGKLLKKLLKLKKF